jgi:hypothetical protein
MRIHRTATALSMLIALAALAGDAAADASCNAPLSSRISELARRRGCYAVQMTMHRENVALVSYSEGILCLPSGGHTLQGRANQLFSDRRSGRQGFTIDQADELTLRLDTSGRLQIHYQPWNFDTAWDMACVGSLVTRYIPGHGVVTLSFGEYIPPIR